MHRLLYLALLVSLRSLAQSPPQQYSASQPATSLCGNGALDPGEQCDDGSANSQLGPCFLGCVVASGVCGDGKKDWGESCDDGNQVSDDGCDADCKVTASTCGDQLRSGAEECDDGNQISGDGCERDCKLPAVCGNHRRTGLEECDDGNLLSGDGCSSSCQREVRAAPASMEEDALSPPDRKKSENTAAALSAIPTIIGYGMIGAGGLSRLSSGFPAGRGLMISGTVLSTVGPSFGLFYANKPNQAMTGVLIRAASPLLAFGLSIVIANKNPEIEFFPIYIASEIFIVGVSTWYDITSTKIAVSDYNRGKLSLAPRLSPALFPTAASSTAPGLSLRLRW